MSRRARSTEELTKSGAVERNELARAAGDIGRRVRRTTDRFGPLLRASGVVVAALGIGGIALTIRAVRARRRPAGKLARFRDAAREARKQALRRRSLPMTLLLLAARSAVARRALARAIESAGRKRRAAEDERAEESDGDGPIHSREMRSRFEPAPAVRAVRAPAEDEARRGRSRDEDIPPPPVPRWEAKEAPLPKKLGIGIDLLKEAFVDFKKDEAITRGASLAYYTIFSLAPLLVIAIAVAGLAFGAEAAQGRIVDQIKGTVGSDAATTLQTMIAKAHKPSANILAGVLGVVTLLIGAGGVFGHLQESLNKIWNVPEKKHGGILRMIKDRFLSMTMVLGTGFLLLVSLVVSAALSAVGGSISSDLPRVSGFLLGALQEVFSWAVIGLMFALIFRYLPDIEIAWKDVWIGAAITSLLFVIGQFLIGLYIAKSSVASVYGGAASLVIILIWVYYSALILFYGAEITEVYANTFGSRLRGKP